MGLVKGAFKIAVALVMAGIAMAAIAGLAVLAWEKYSEGKAEPYAKVRYWALDTSELISMKLAAKTKLLDQRMYVEFNFEGYPAYLDSDKNLRRGSDAGITVQFLDQDGFKVWEKQIPLTDFTRVVTKGENKGLSYELNAFVRTSDYARFSKVAINWTMDTSPPQEALFIPDTPVVHRDDPCAPGLSKTERLRRLGQYGKLRETGLGEYSAGDHSVSYITVTGELLSCK